MLLFFLVWLKIITTGNRRYVVWETLLCRKFGLLVHYLKWPYHSWEDLVLLF